MDYIYMYYSKCMQFEGVANCRHFKSSRSFFNSCRASIFKMSLDIRHVQYLCDHLYRFHLISALKIGA